MSTESISYEESVQYENGQDIFETDPQFPGHISQAAKEARQARLRRLMKNRGPTKKIERKYLAELAKSDKEPPLYRFGIPYTYNWMVSYARRHHLKFEVSPEERSVWDGKECVDMGEIDFENASQQEYETLVLLACHLSQQDIQRRCGLLLQPGRPFAEGYDGILSLWSNYDTKARYKAHVWTPARYRKIIAELIKAMSEDGGSGELMWWYDWDNDVNIFIHTE